LLPLALLSCSALALEVLLTKFLAYSVSAILIYVVLGIALLGFGAAGTLAAAYPAWTERASPGNRLAWTSLAFSLATLGAFAIFVRVTPSLHDFGLLTFAAAALLTCPFLAAGLAVALALKVGNVGRGYAANLAGSAVGCVVPLVCLRALGGERMIPLLAGMGWLSAWLFARSAPASRALRAGLVGTLGLVAVGVLFARNIYSPEPEPEPVGQLRVVRLEAASRGARETKLYDHWNATGRIQIFGYEGEGDALSPYPFLFYAQDSSAGSALAMWDGRDLAASAALPERSEIARACRDTLWGQAYFAPRKRVLVIGLGGGMDVQCARFNGATAVDVAEINPDSIAAIRGPFNDWLGGIGRDPHVVYHLADGRSFAHRQADGAYDLVQLSGVDTKNSASSGGLALSENTLYTVEAFVDYLRNLSDDGVLSIVRFSDMEAVRLCNTAVTALRRLGVTHPEDHVAVYDSTYIRGVIVRKTAFSPAEVALLAARFPLAERAPQPYGVDIFFYSAMGMDFRIPPALEYAPGRVAPGYSSQYFTALRAGTEQDYVKAFPFDATPTVDDRPFFFDVFRYPGLSALAYPHVRGLAGVLVAMLVLGLGLVLLPVLLSRFPVRGVPLAATLFFTSVGLAYLFVEVWLIHRFAMYLGHQSYSLGVVLSALLLSTGLGAALGERSGESHRRSIATGVAGIVVVLLLGKLVVPALQEGTASASFFFRVLVTVTYAGMLGVFMGRPFPSGLRWAQGRAPEAVPWYIGINGFASVLATLAVIPLSHALGYEAVMLTGGALYALAVVASAAMREGAS
jgi:hypothetical protein